MQGSLHAEKEITLAFETMCKADKTVLLTCLGKLTCIPVNGGQ